MKAEGADPKDGVRSGDVLNQMDGIDARLQEELPEDPRLQSGIPEGVGRDDLAFIEMSGVASTVIAVENGSQPSAACRPVEKTPSEETHAARTTADWQAVAKPDAPGIPGVAAKETWTGGEAGAGRTVLAGHPDSEGGIERAETKAAKVGSTRGPAAGTLPDQEFMTDILARPSASSGHAHTSDAPAVVDLLSSEPEFFREREAAPAPKAPDLTEAEQIVEAHQSQISRHRADPDEEVTHDRSKNGTTKEREQD